MDNKISKLAILLALALSSVLAGQVRVGQLAPPLELAQVVQGEFHQASHESARVLEFWSTTCVYCVENIPHLNDLVDQFGGRGIEFLSITAEDRPVVEKFLKTHPIHGIVATDTCTIHERSLSSRRMRHSPLRDYVSTR